MDREALLEKAVAFHGHICGGLMVGMSAALYAMDLLEISESSKDEEIVCIAENDSCSVDAIQAVIGCSAGKGNLIFHIRGKQAFSFFNRKNGKKARIVLKDLTFASREEKQKFMLEAKGEDIFDVKEVTFDLPEPAKIFKSQKCEMCGEVTAEPWLRIKDDQIICLDCYDK